ncbi:MAG: DoxX family protein [Reichenbachiella sp.]
MKYASTIIRFLVGGLFIFSGLIKINDPVGTAIKMEEYFEVFSVQFAEFFHVFVPIALPISVFMVVFEVVLGLALIINYRQNLTLYLTLALIVFFTILTGYSAITNTVTDCGCFGDAIKMTPWESFSKDIILLILILVMWITEHPPQSEKQEKISNFIVGGTTGLCLILAYWAIAHLPFIDFRAYKIGNHIPTEMQASAPYLYEYIMEKDGEEYTFESYPTDTSYKYKEMIHLNPEAAPKITDFGIWNDEGDYTEESFQGSKLFVILYDVSKSNISSISQINDLIKALGEKVEVIALTASDKSTFESFQKNNSFNIPYFYTDATVLKTITRSNPGLWLLHNGTVKGKWHYNDVPNYSEILDLVKK